VDADRGDVDIDASSSSSSSQRLLRAGALARALARTFARAPFARTATVAPPATTALVIVL
jgi:hypothetical protein